MRKSLADEFSAIYVYNLRGNGRIGGEDGRKEGRPLFEFGGWRADGTEIKNSNGGSRATIAILMLVKNPSRNGATLIRYAAVDDYLSAGMKIRAVEQANSFARMQSKTLTPNAHGDWLSLRADDFGKFIPIGAKHGDDLGGDTIFDTYSRGLETGRDAWVYNSSSSKLITNVRATVDAYNDQVTSFTAHLASHPGVKPKNLVNDFMDNDPTRISWTLSLKNRLVARRTLVADSKRITTATYRPLFMQHVYYDRGLNHILGQLTRIYPTVKHTNVGIYMIGPGATAPFGLLMTNALPDVQMLGAGQNGQYFPRWTYELLADENDGDGALFRSQDLDNQPNHTVDGYRRVDNITDAALARFHDAYGPQITKDDVFHYVYGLLHSPGYRQRYAADLKKMLPRIPLVVDANPYIQAGQRLSEIHLGYEQASPYPLAGLDEVTPAHASDLYKVAKMRFSAPTKGVKATGQGIDRSTILYNEKLTVSGIPEDAYRYMLGSRSAIEWLIDRYQLKTDKSSKSTNDPNDWSQGIGDPRYILDLLCKIVSVSLETMVIVDALPPIEI